MVFGIDANSIRRRVRKERPGEFSVVTLQIQLPRVPREKAAGLVREVLGDSPTYENESSGSLFPTRTVWPTTGGPSLCLLHSSEWEGLAEALRRALGSQHPDGLITASRAPFDEYLGSSAVPSPAALVAYRIQPTYESGPLNVWGRPAGRWGVPEDVTDRVLADAVAWATANGGAGLVVGNTVPLLPATPEDAADLLRQGIDRLASPVRCVFAADTSPTSLRARVVTLEKFGVVTYTDIDLARDQVGKAQGLVPLLVQHAEDIDFGRIYLAEPGAPGPTAWSGASLWRRNRQLWSAHTYDVDGIQLLTSYHMANAHDLSAWDVTEVAPGRILVSANSPSAWFDTTDEQAWRYQFPSDEFVARARADFGNMILTEQIVEANPFSPAG